MHKISYCTFYDQKSTLECVTVDTNVVLNAPLKKFGRVKYHELKLCLIPA